MDYDINKELPLLEAPRKKHTLKIILIVIGVIVIGGGVALASRVWDPLWSPFRPNPEEVINRMIEKTKTVKSFSCVSQLREEESDVIISFNLECKTDCLNEGNKKMSQNYYRKYEEYFGQEYFLMEIEANTISINESVFQKIVTANVPEGEKIPFPLNQWIRMSWEEPFVYCEDLNAMMSLFLNSEDYYLKEEMPDEIIGGKEVYHYVIAFVNKRNLDSSLFIFPFKSILPDQEIDVYIGKEDSLLYKISSFKDASFFTLELFNYNKQLNIQAPKDYITEDEIYE